MDEPDDIVEIFLGPGELYFGDRETRIRTLLGSCVAITLWHPKELIGGMCHYMIPSRTIPSRRTSLPVEALSGRYADEALQMLMHELLATGTLTREYQVKIFGGGSQFTGVAAGMNVASRNVEAGLQLLAHHGLNPIAMHLGGSGHRLVILDLWNGDVWLRHVETEHVETEEASRR